MKLQYFVKFPEETFKECYDAHWGEGHPTLQSAQDDTFKYEDLHTEFEVVDQNGKSYGKFRTTSEGWVTL